MADKKISALPAATTPLAGTEIIPLVQSGTTDRVSVANLTAGRDVGVQKLNAADNVVIETAGKGIDFSAAINPAGTTSEVLTAYAEGAWTPTVTSLIGAITSYTSSGSFTRVGNTIFIVISITVTDNGTGASALSISLPTVSNSPSAFAGQNVNTLKTVSAYTGVGSSTMLAALYDASYPLTNGETIRISGHYQV